MDHANLQAARAALPGLLGARRPGPAGEPATLEELTAQLEAAGAALLGLQVRGAWPGQLRSGMPEILRDPAEAYGWTAADLPMPAPSAVEITAMDEALSWVELIPLERARAGYGLRYSVHGGAVLRRLVLARCLVDPRTGRHLYSWRRLAKVLHCSPESARQWHGRGLDMILSALRQRRMDTSVQ